VNLQEAVRGVVHAYDHGNSAGDVPGVDQRREHWFAVRALLQHDAAPSCDCAGCWATRNYRCAEAAATEGDHTAARWHQSVGDAWYLAHLVGGGNRGAELEAER
jgi:hypothetical protein